MSVGRRIIDGARSGLNSLVDKVAADDTPLSGVERGELDQELERRASARKASTPRRPEDNPRARWAGAGDEAARKRREMAEARDKRVRTGRAAKKQREEAEKESTWKKFQEQARRYSGTGTGSGSASGSGSGSGSARSGSPGGLRKDDKMAKYYKALDLPYGADFDQVKAAYRKLIRKYHPDLHGQSPQKQKAANELTVQVTQAYNELDAHLNKKS